MSVIYHKAYLYDPIYRVYQKKRYDFEMLRMSCFLQSRQMIPSGIKIMFNYRLYHVKRFIV